MKKSLRGGRVLTALAATGAVLVVSACGADSSDDSAADVRSDDTGDSAADVRSDDAVDYEQNIEQWYEGTNVQPEGPPVTPAEDKSIWFVSIGQGVEETNLLTATAEEAGAKLGWDVTIYDGRFDQNRLLTGVQQAVAQGADGIVLVSADCAPVKNGVAAAKEANIPVVGIEAQDCEPALLTHVTEFHGGQDYVTFFEEEYGKAQVDWVVSQTGDATKAILLYEGDFANLRAIGDGAEKALEACGTCEIVEKVEFVGTDLGPTLQAKIESALTRNPDANALIAPYDGVLSSGGGAAAIRAAGRLEDLAVIGGVGTTEAVEAIKNGTGQDASAAFAYRYQSLVALDALIRIFAEQDPAEVETGIGLQVYDENHNLPPAGSPYDPPIDFPAAYYEMWGLE